MLLLLHIMTYIKENIITRLQKLYSLPRNPRVGNKSPVLFVKKPLCTGDLLSERKILKSLMILRSSDLQKELCQCQIQSLRLALCSTLFISKKKKTLNTHKVHRLRQIRHRTRMPLHTPKTLKTWKKSMPCLIKKASRCAEDGTSKTMFFIFLFLSKTMIFCENHAYFFILLVQS